MSQFYLLLPRFVIISWYRKIQLCPNILTCQNVIEIISSLLSLTEIYWALARYPVQQTATHVVYSLGWSRCIT